MKRRVLVKVDNVSKKFCRDLKMSLWYGVKDIIGEITLWNPSKLKLRKKEFWALKDISFELKEGEVLGLIGRNGAGKTTLLRLLNGLIKPDRGSININGRVGALIALGAGFNPILTGRENIYVNGAVLGIKKKEIDRKFNEIVDFSELHDFIDTPVQSYSSGMQVRLGFAIASQLEPQIMLTDEVLAVGDFRFRNRCYSKLQELKSNGSSTILVSHNMVHMLQFADRVIWIEDGIIKDEGVPKEVCGEFLSHYNKDSKYESKTSTVSNRLFGEIYIDESKINDIDVKMLNHNKEISYKFAAFEPIYIQIEFAIKESLNLSLGLTLKIHSSDGTIISVINSVIDGENIEVVNNKVNREIRLESLNVVPGNYSLVLVVHNGTEFIYRNVVSDFIINSKNQKHDLLRNDPHGSGFLRIKHIWK